MIIFCSRDPQILEKMFNRLMAKIDGDCLFNDLCNTRHWNLQDQYQSKIAFFLKKIISLINAHNAPEHPFDLKFNYQRPLYFFTAF